MLSSFQSISQFGVYSIIFDIADADSVQSKHICQTSAHVQTL